MADNPGECLVVRLHDPVERGMSLLRHVFGKVRADQHIAGLYTPGLAEELEIERSRDCAACPIGAKEVLSMDLKGMLCDMVLNRAEEARLVLIAGDGVDGDQLGRKANVEPVV